MRSSDIDQTNINRDIRDGNWLSTLKVVSLRKLCDPKAMLLPENLVADAFRH